MIVGTVNHHGEATVRLEIRLADGSIRFVDATVDTGYTGTLTIPQSTIASYGLVRHLIGSATLANGETCEFDTYLATVIWHDRPVLLSVSAVGSVPLIGMKLLRGSELRIDVEVEGRVQIDPLPLSDESTGPDFTPT